MSKTERLMQVLGMLRSRGPITAESLADRCGVSRRTVYRYIDTLQRLDYPVYFDENGYRLRQQVSIPTIDLNGDDVELLKYCLRTNPLREIDFFARQFRRIEKKIVGSDGQPKLPADRRLYQAAGDVMTDEQYRQSDPLLERFTQAIIRRREVRLLLRDPSERTLLVTPTSIRLRRGHIELVVRETATGREMTFNRSDIISLDLTNPDNNGD